MANRWRSDKRRLMAMPVGKSTAGNCSLPEAQHTAPDKRQLKTLSERRGCRDCREDTSESVLRNLGLVCVKDSSAIRRV